MQQINSVCSEDKSEQENRADQAVPDFLDYTISSSTNTGASSLTLSTRFGTSNSVTFNVGYPPAVVTNISPSVWTAGQNTSVTITGKGFGNNPTLSVNGTKVSLALNSASPDGTTLQATATVNADAPSETVTVTVQPGYIGSSFVCNCEGQPSNGTNTATVQPVTPAPQIMFNGQNISGTTVSVMAGQKIKLSVLPPPNPYNIQNRSWTIPNQSAITGGFVNGAGTPGTQPSAAAGGSEAADPPLNQDDVTFYWVNPGDNGEQVTYTYTLDNNQSASASATFNVGGPTGNLMIQPTMPTDGSGVHVLSNSVLSTASILKTSSDGHTGRVGIDFNTSAAPPTGYNQTFTFVQLLNGVQNKYITSAGVLYQPTTPTVGIDKTYPYSYVYPSETWDTPDAGLPQTYGEGWESFTATMYLMWDPGIPPAGQSSCTTAKTVQTVDQDGNLVFTQTPSTCESIPIPLSSVTWHWSGCAINTLANQPNGTMYALSTASGCPVQTLGTPQPAGFPEWPPLTN